MDFVQKMINHIIPPLRTSVKEENLENTLPVIGCYGNQTKAAVEGLVKGGAFTVDQGTITLVTGLKISHRLDEQNVPKTLGKLAKDYSGLNEANIQTEIGKVIDKEVLVGLKQQATDRHPQNDMDIGIYELYQDAKYIQNERDIQIEDWDGDGLSNYIEVENGLNPLVKNDNYLPAAPAADSTIPANIGQLISYPQGTYGNGRLIGGLRTANNNKGYFYQHSADPDDTDNFAIPDVLNRIERVARIWEKRHPDLTPLKANIFTTGNRDNLYTDDGTGQMNGIRFGINDLSMQNGGEFQPHSSHRNGLDMDIWYMRNDNSEAGVLVSDLAHYSQDLSEELARLFVEVGGAVQVFVNDASGITGTNIVQVHGATNHHDHMHVAFPNPNPPTGAITLTATQPQWDSQYYVSTVQSGPIRDRYGKMLFDGFLVHVSTNVGKWETDNLCIKRNSQGDEIDRGVCVNDGTIIFRVKKSTAGGSATVTVDTENIYGQGHATGSTSIDFSHVAN